jgi:hypothetical protein
VLEVLGLVTVQKSRPALPSLREAQAARNSTDVDVKQHLLDGSAGGNSVSNVPLLDIPLPDVHLPEVLLDDPVGKE